MSQDVRNPPTTLKGTLRQLGPGLIIAGSIVGSGELIATTKTGAQAGISLLWLILVGCLIKVFVQIELGRYTIGHGQTTLAALDTVPGPRLRVKWIVWFWLFMSLATLFQLGGIIGGVGQSLAIAWPLSEKDYAYAVRLPSEMELRRYLQVPEDVKGNQFEPSDEKNARMRRGFEFRRRQLEGAELQEQIEILETSQGSESEITTLKELHEQHQQRGKDALEAVRELIDAENRLKAAQNLGGSTVESADDRVKEAQQRVNKRLKPDTTDDKIWALIVAVFTMGLLYRGRYSLVQNVSVVLVVLFTFITIGNVISLQAKPEFRLTLSDFFRGFGLPEGDNGLATALATFGIIGVGASELVAYPYWCLEKGYARFTGPASQQSSWAARAMGWMNVMRYDAFCSMVIYTVATMAFYIMGVAVLHRYSLDPQGMRMVSTLSQQYKPVFGAHAHWLFLIGSIAVLYSTFMVATAGHSRMFTDAFKIFGLMSRDNEKAHNRSVSIICLVVPLIAVAIFGSGMDPVTLVLIGATMQALMLPLLAYAAVYFRFRRTDKRIQPGKAWDVLLVISGIGMLIAGAWGAYVKVMDMLGTG